jgi:rare lipoprotein A
MIMTRCPVARLGAWRSGLCSMLSAAALAVCGLAGTFLSLSGTPVEAKTPGSTYCYYGKCHRVKTLPETQQLVGVKHVVQASFYDNCKVDSYNPCGLTSSGEAFRPDQPDNAASPIYPDGTTLLVWSPTSLQAAVLRVNNAGPYWGNRTLDVSRAAADSLGFKGQGVAQLEVRVLEAPDQADATYKRNRKYHPVLGPVGRYASIEEAQLSLAAIQALDRMPATAIAPVTVADAPAALAARTMNTHALKLEMAKTRVADATPTARPVTTVQRRQAAKAKRIAKSRSQYARRHGARRNLASLRRGHRATVRLAQRRSSANRVAAWRQKAGSSSRQVSRKWRKAPVVTRTGKKYRRVAEAHDINGTRRGLLPSGGLRGIPAGSSREDGNGQVAPSRSGPVQVA